MAGGDGARRSADLDRLREIVRAFFGHFGNHPRSRLQVGYLRLSIVPSEFGFFAELYLDIAFSRFDGQRIAGHLGYGPHYVMKAGVREHRRRDDEHGGREP